MIERWVTLSEELQFSGEQEADPRTGCDSGRCETWKEQLVAQTSGLSSSYSLLPSAHSEISGHMLCFI